MICASPVSANGGYVGCGQCLPCKINRRRVWVHRLMLERTQHADAAFVTLTYADENLPRTEGGLGTLVPKHLQDWLKRYRKAVEPTRVRFYGVGEYGETTGRPHYHVALFGVPSCSYIQSRYDGRRASCCPHCDLVRDTWSLGQVMLGTFEESSASYIAGYVIKKMTGKNDVRLQGRYPEFARMSNRPGLGADAMHEVASTVLTFNLEEALADVPSALRHGSRLMPLGRYLQRKLREYVTGSPDAPEEALRQWREQMLVLQQDSLAVGETSLNFYREKNVQKLRQVDGRFNIFQKKRGSL